MTRRHIVFTGALVAQLALAAVAHAFTATAPAKSLIAKMRAEARHLHAVRTQRTGAIVYCPAAPQGWAFAPADGCPVRAKVTEDDDLADGKIVRIVGHVTAPGQPALTYVEDAAGWYRSAAGSGCWTLEVPGGFTARPLVDYPWPDTHISMLHRTSTRLVLEAVSAPAAYKVVSYVDPKTFFDTRDVEISTVKTTSYRITQDSVPLQAQTPRPATTPLCSPSASG